MPKYKYIINCNVATDCTKVNKAYSLWETNYTKSVMPKYQHDILSKFEDYPPISIVSIDKNMDNAAQLQYWLVSFLEISLFHRYFFHMFRRSAAWFLHRWGIRVEIGGNFKFLLWDEIWDLISLRINKYTMCTHLKACANTHNLQWSVCEYLN